MQSIEQSFSFIHQASMLRAAIYCKEGELQAMSSVLSEYSHFIGGTIAPNAQLLAECDKNDSGTERGTWKSRKNLELDVTELVKRLDAPRKTLYLSMAQEAEALGRDARLIGLLLTVAAALALLSLLLWLVLRKKPLPGALFAALAVLPAASSLVLWRSRCGSLDSYLPLAALILAILAALFAELLFRKRREGSSFES